MQNHPNEALPPHNRSAADAHLSRLLTQTLQPDAVRSPDFRANVWARIDAQRHPASWGQWLRGHALNVGLIAAACVLLAGIGGGWLAHEQSRSLRQEQLKRYVVSIDAHQRLAFEETATMSRQ